MDKNNKNQYEKPDDDTQKEIIAMMGLSSEDALPSRKEQDDDAASLDSKEAVEPDKNTTLQEQDPDAPIEELDKHYNEQQDDAAVEDIVLQESDELLQHQDGDKIEPVPLKAKKHGLRFLFAWWHHKKTRNTILGVLLLALIALFAFPTTRYQTLNAIGVRSSVSFVVVDKVSGKPIKNVDASLSGVTAKSNESGEVSMSGVKLGEAELILKKRSFKEEKVTFTVGWGSNPFSSPLELSPSGTAFPFTVTDWLSGKPVEGAEISDGESTAVTNESGTANLTIEPTDNDTKTTISKNGYRQEELTIKADETGEQAVRLVPSAKDVFISKRNAKYDIYSRYIDGTKEELILPATGQESPETSLLANPASDLVAVVSSRDGKRNADGYLLSNLYIVNASTKIVEKVDNTQAEGVRIVSWEGEKLIFVKTVAGPSAYSQRQRLLIYDTTTKQTKELATSDYFGDIRIIDKTIYYVTPGAVGSDGTGLVSSSLDGTNKKVLLGKQVWQVMRPEYSKLAISSEGNEWYNYDLASKKMTKLEGAPATIQDIGYVENQANNVAWIESRDGKTVLLSAPKNTISEGGKEVIRQPGMRYPLRWLNDTTLLFTTQDNQESASYAISVAGGSAVRVGDIHPSYDQNSGYNQ